MQLSETDLNYGDWTLSGWVRKQYFPVIWELGSFLLRHDHQKRVLATKVLLKLATSTSWEQEVGIPRSRKVWAEQRLCWQKKKTEKCCHLLHAIAFSHLVLSLVFQSSVVLEFSCLYLLLSAPEVLQKDHKKKKKSCLEERYYNTGPKRNSKTKSQLQERQQFVSLFLGKMQTQLDAPRCGGCWLVLWRGLSASWLGKIFTPSLSN